MKKIYKLLFILAVLALPVNCVLAVENPFGDQENNQPNLSQLEFKEAENQPQTDPQLELTTAETANSDLIILNTANFVINQAEAWAGKKIREFDNKFVFQIEEEIFKADASLELKEMILTPSSKMAPPTGLQLASRIYEYNLKTDPNIKFASNFWFSIKYDSADYFRKNIYYFDETKSKWIGLPAIIKNGSSKIVSNFPLPYAKLAILEDISIMTEGTASWYRYKGCNCAASPDYPKGTKLKVTNVDNGKEVIVKVNDWGPDRSIHPDRVIDLDVVAFKQIAKKSAGLCRVKVEPYQEVVALNKN